MDQANRWESNHNSWNKLWLAPEGLLGFWANRLDEAKDGHKKTRQKDIHRVFNSIR